MAFLTLSIVLWGFSPTQASASEIITAKSPLQIAQLPSDITPTSPLAHSPCQGGHTPSTAARDLPQFMLVLPHQAPFSSVSK